MNNCWVTLELWSSSKDGAVTLGELVRSLQFQACHVAIVVYFKLI